MMLIELDMRISPTVGNGPFHFDWEERKGRKKRLLHIREKRTANVIRKKERKKERKKKERKKL